MFNQMKKQSKMFICTVLALICAVCLAFGLSFIKPATKASATIAAPERPVSFLPFNSSVSGDMYLSYGTYNYVLDGDYTMEYNISISNEAVVNICLNGNKLNFVEGKNIQVLDGSVLNIFDSGTVSSAGPGDTGYSDFIIVSDSTLNVVGSTINSSHNLTVYANGNVGVYDGGKILNSSLGEEEAPTRDKGIAISLSGNLVLSESAEIGYLGGRGTIDGNGYTGSINILPGGVSTFKNIAKDKINMINADGYFMEESEGNVIVTANVTYTIVLKNAELDDRYYETSLIKADPNVTIAENEFNGYNIKQTFKAGDSQFKQLIVRVKDGYVMPECFEEQIESDPLIWAYGYQGLTLTSSGSSMYVNSNNWYGNTNITATVAATEPDAGDVVCDGVVFDTAITQEGAYTSNGEYTGENGLYYEANCIYNFRVQSSKRLYLAEDVMMYTQGGIGSNDSYYYSEGCIEYITVDLYLNGHTLTLYGYGGGSDLGISIYPNATFNIYDDTGEGKIVYKSDSESSYYSGVIDQASVLNIMGGTVNMFGGTISSYFCAVRMATSFAYTRTYTTDEYENTITTYTYGASTFNMFDGELKIQYTNYSLYFVAALYAFTNNEYAAGDVNIFPPHNIRISGDSVITGNISNEQNSDLDFDAYGYTGGTISVMSAVNGAVKEGEVLCHNMPVNKIKFVNKGYTAVSDEEREGYVIVKPSMTINLSSDEHGSFSDGSESGITDYGALQGLTLEEAGLEFVPDVGYEAKEFIYQAIVTGIAAGDDFTVILLSDGSLWACGDNTYGQLGNKSYESSYSFVPMQTESGPITGVKKVYAKGHMVVALMQDNSTMACGDNTYGQLGVNSEQTTVNYFMPMVDSEGNKLTNVSAVYMGGNHTVIVNYASALGKYELYSCGNNDHGQLGIGSTGNQKNTLTKFTIDTSSDGMEISYYIDIVCGEDFTLFNVSNSISSEFWYYMAGNNSFLRTLSGYFYCTGESWGTEINLQIDTGNVVDYSSPTKFCDYTYDYPVQFRFGDGFVIAFAKAASNLYVVAMGDNSSGQCGYYGDTYFYSFTPMRDTTNNMVSGISDIYVGKDFVVVLKVDGSVWVCGNNENGQLGLNSANSSVSVLTQVAQSMDNYSKWAVGGSHIVALKKDGSLYLCGSNAAGQLGLSTSTEKKAALSERNVTETQLTATSLSQITASYDMNLKAVTGLLEFNINLKANTGDDEDDTVAKTQLHKLVVKDLPIPEWDELHTFVGWFTEAEGGEEVTDQTLSEDITIYAHWTLNYKITLDAQGGTVSPAYLVTKDGKLTTLPNPKYDSSHLFFSWYTEKNGGGEEVTLDTVFTADTTIYANYVVVGKTIESIEKTTSGLVDTYTIYYTDETTYEFTVTNGTSGGSGGGEDGNGIEKIELTNTEGNVDTYTITFTDSTTFDFTVTNGSDGAAGSDGKKLEMQINAVTNEWEYKYEDEEDWTSTGVKATGATGATGNGIEKIELTKTEGNVDTYTITFTDSTTFVFTVTNGTDGAAGSDGANGKKLEMQINAETNEWEYRYEGDAEWTSTGVKATGEDGADGAAGADGKKIIVRINPDTNYWEYQYEGDEGWTSLNVKATGDNGEDGEDGRGIVKIEKTSTDGLVDTYTIYYTDDTTSTFTVTNGQNGGANGVTPHIGDNGNWYIGDSDTGVKAVGTTGATGAAGEDGKDGEDGREIVIRINPETNYWEYQYEGDEEWTSLGVKATGADGEDGKDGEDGRGIVKIEKTSTDGRVDTYTIYYTDDTTSTFTVTNGQNGGEDGADGENGITPHIGENGNWYLGDSDTGVKATGEDGADGAAGADGKKIIIRINPDTNYWEYQYEGDEEWTSLGVKATGSTGAAGADGKDGEDGRGIVKIEKTSTDGRVDTYTIYYTDDTTSTFTVTNGQNGGEDGADGENGITPHIGENGNWYIGDSDTGVKAVGSDGAAGADGEDGADGREIVIRINPVTNEWEYKYEGDEGWTSLGVVATGEKGEKGDDGEDGRGIVKIEKTSTDGRVDTYTIYYTDDTTSTFTVTNGQNGGEDGADGADGITPHIGENGNWYIGTTDTGVKAVGADGAAGADGKDGEDGKTPQLKIGDDDYWYVSYDDGATWTSLGVKATGNNGNDGADGKKLEMQINPETNEWEYRYEGDTEWIPTGVKATGADGTNGVDGKTPKLRINDQTYEWEVSYDDGATWESLGVRAIGEKGDKGDKGDSGADGRGIVSVEKTCTDGLIDVYTITYTDGTSTTFLVTNGADGKYDSTPFIGDNGNWWVGSVDSGIYAAAPEGTVSQLRVNTETKEWEVSSDDGASWETLGIKPSDVQTVSLDGASITAIVVSCVAALAVAAATVITVLAIKDRRRMQEILESLNKNGGNS
ncbi:MAG: hypothetical protein ACI4VK_04130 [Candidatus Coproplasma sp.]